MSGSGGDDGDELGDPYGRHFVGSRELGRINQDLEGSLDLGQRLQDEVDERLEIGSFRLDPMDEETEGRKAGLQRT